jgi:cytochrome c peroxidase
VYQKFNRDNFTMLAVNQMENADHIFAYIGQLDVYPTVTILFENSVASQAFKAKGLPTANLVDKQGHIRYRSIPEYVELFKKAFPTEVFNPSDIQFSHTANAIAAFEIDAWRADNSPFDRFRRGQRGAMSWEAKRGMRLFYGKAGCVRCHSGEIFSDMDFHAIAMPQVGPGKGHGASGREDWGRGPMSSNSLDNSSFARRRCAMWS